jgi:hypothetical protein
MSENPQVNPSQVPGTAAPSRPRAGPSFFFPIILILIGVILLLNTTGMLPWLAWWRLWVLWPAFFILIGMDILLRRTPALLRLLAALVVVALLVGAAFTILRQPGTETSRPIHTVVALEDLRQGEVQLDLGAGQLTIEPLGDTPNWAEVDLSGTTREPIVTRLDSTARLEISQENWSSSWPNNGWQGEISWLVRLNPRVPVKLQVHVGVGDCTLNLGRLRLQELGVDNGVGNCTVTLPGSGESGTIPIAIKAGIGSLRVIVPEGVAAQIKLDPGLGSVSVDERRFRKAGEDVYRTADYEGAAYRLDVTIEIGIGSIEVR